MTCSSALVGSVGEILADTNVEILMVFEGNILVLRSILVVTCSSALVGSVDEILADTNVEILMVFEGNILVVSVALLGNIAVTFVTNVVAIAVDGVCVDFDSAMLVDKTAKVKIGFYKE